MDTVQEININFKPIEYKNPDKTNPDKTKTKTNINTELPLNFVKLNISENFRETTSLKSLKQRLQLNEYNSEYNILKFN